MLNENRKKKKNRKSSGFQEIFSIFIKCVGVINFPFRCLIFQGWEFINISGKVKIKINDGVKKRTSFSHVVYVTR